MKIRRYKGSGWPRGGKPKRGHANEWSLRDERGRTRVRFEGEKEKENVFRTAVVL
jgi:hypothetical protein